MKLFSVFNILAAALFFLAVGMVAVPDASSRAILANEAAVVRALQDLAVAEVRYRARDLSDRDADGNAEYGFLTEVIGSRVRQDPPLPAVDSSGKVRLAGYRITAFLPASAGRPVPRASAEEVDAQLASRSFLLVAVPTEPGRTGFRAYAVRQDLIVAQCDASEPRWRSGTHPHPQIARRDARTGQILTPKTWRSPWIPFLPQLQAQQMIARLRAEGLPVHTGLHQILEEE